ncbi:MAG: aminopeptidase P family protein [Ardenticatenaceae bacterium]|nr:aminopeptidase P family protein [Ardenticatenaceae bacterium]
MTQERINALRNHLPEWGVDGVLVGSYENYRWLSGFSGSNCFLIVTQTQALLGTDFRYWAQAQKQAPDFELVKMGSDEGLATIGDMIDQAQCKTLGVEGDQVTLNTFQEWQKAIEGDEIATELKSLIVALEELRQVKSVDELAIIRRAAAITDLAMGQVNKLAKPGMTERQLAWELEKIMRENGADGLAFDIIVAAGPNAALAHHHPSDRPLQAGDTMVIDMGAKVDGYCSDLTRSFYLGSQPSAKFWYVYNLVHTAQKNALEHMKAGMSGREIDALARDVIEDAGQGENFGHSLGHGLGLYIHEQPRLSSRNPNPIPAGSVVTVEPGIYLPDWGGIRIEDLVVVYEDGIEFLSHCPKDPVIG